MGIQKVMKSLLVFVVFDRGDLILIVEPPAQVDQLAPLAAKRERAPRIGRSGFVGNLNGLAADGTGDFHHKSLEPILARLLVRRFGGWLLR
jgi:hypothetical protein